MGTGEVSQSIPSPDELAFFDEGEKSTLCLLGPLSLPESGMLARRLFPDESSALLGDAERIVRGDLPLFRRFGWQTGQPTDYQRDPVSGETWPDCFYGDVPYRNPEPRGDVRISWELNRLHHLSRLSAACRVSGDRGLGQHVVDEFLRFIGSTTPLRGVAFASPLEAAVRGISVLLSFAGIRGTICLPTAVKSELLQLTRSHAYFVEKRMALHSSRNNHTIGEASFLVLAGLLFPELPEASRWRDQGFSRLAREILEQIHPDGVLKEQATGYAMFVLELVSLPLLAWTRSGRNVSQDLRSRLRSVAEFVVHITDSRGNLPSIGDGDDGRGFDLSGSPLPTLSTLRVALWASGTSPQRLGIFGEDLASWLLTSDVSFLEEEKTSERDRGPSRPGSRLFESGGVAVLRARLGGGSHEAEEKASDSSEIVCVMRCGPFGLPPLYGHAHADQLSITVSVGGRPLLVDPGTYLYHGGGDYRDYFRSTRAHSTVCIDGLDQACIEGAFLWSSPSTGRIESHFLGKETLSVRGSHDGYDRLADPVRHVREVRLSPNETTLLVVDEIVAEAEHEVEIGFQFAPGIQVESLGENRFGVEFGEDKSATLILPDELEAKVRVGETSPLSGWVSPAFGSILPAARISGKTVICGGARFVSELVFESRETTDNSGLMTRKGVLQ